MRSGVKKKLILAAATSTGLLGFLGYPAVKAVYPIKKETTIVDDYLDLPTATDDLTKNISVPESDGAETEVPIDVSHWLLLSLLKSKRLARRERALTELAKQRRWTDAECLEIAQALSRQDMIKLARTSDADLRLFLPPPSVMFIEKTLGTDKIEKTVKSILKDVSEREDSCSSCANFYTNLSIRVRPDSNILALSDLNQVDKMLLMESRKRKKSKHNEDIIRLKAVLSNIICGEPQAHSMAQSGMLFALLYFRHKYEHDLQINALLAQILANLSIHESTREYLYTDGWIQALTQYSRSDHLELSLPAFKALANLDEEATKRNGVYGNHIYLLSPVYHEQVEPTKFDVIFIHGLVGSTFKSWRQGSVALDEFGKRSNSNNTTPTTELLPTEPLDMSSDEMIESNSNSNNNTRRKSPLEKSNCWPKDWLAEDVPGLRVLAVDYPTSLSSWRTDCDLNKDTLRERAIHVMKQLEAAKLGDRPIIWVAHSMGGLLVKQILVICGERLATNGRPQAMDKKNAAPVSFEEKVFNSTKGVVFYSVPHKGSNLDWIERKNLQKLLMLTTEVIELQKGSSVLAELHQSFLDYMKRFGDGIRFLSYAENSISIFGVNKVVQWKGVLVHEDSLQFEIGPVYKLNIDHAHTCKPHSKEAITYVNTLEFIRDLVPHVVSSADHDREHENLLPFISFIL